MIFFFAINAEAFSFLIRVRMMSLSVTIAEALEGSDEFYIAPKSAIYPAVLYSSGDPPHRARSIG